jgi:hypothetical protein
MAVISMYPRFFNSPGDLKITSLYLSNDYKKYAATTNIAQLFLSKNRQNIYSN